MRNGSSRAAAGRPIGLVGLAGLLVVTGCSFNQPVNIPSMSPAMLPSYGLGDSYQFDDGSSATVVAVDGDMVRWRDKDGSFVTSRNTLLPRLAWTNGAAQGERRIANGPVPLFPLDIGKAVSFTAIRSLHPLTGGQQVTVHEDWSCAVSGAARVAASVGDFDTWRLDCTIREQPATAGNGLIQRSSYYAPAIGYYVRIEQTVDDGPTQVAQLSGYTTADPALAVTALRQRSAALQQAMESELSGSRTAWADPTTDAAGDVVLIATKRSERYGWCRDFAERIQWSGRSYALNGTGCRDAARMWDIVAVSPGRIGSH